MGLDSIRIIVALIIGVLLVVQARRSTAGSRRRWALGLGAAAMVVVATANAIPAALTPLMVIG
ncbi:MAG: hypothetical protein D6823_10030, partial [Chloroflexi bacterium]